MEEIAQLIRQWIEKGDVDFDHLFPDPTSEQFKDHMKVRHNANCILEIINTIMIIDK